MIETASHISVIICAYTEERWNDLVAAIASTQAQTLPASEIILVIDHNARLLKRVHEYGADVVVVENAGRPGLSDARNSGIAVARGDIIAFLDDDALATPNWLKELHEAFSDSNVLGTGGPVIPLWSCKEPAWLPEEFYWVVGCTYRGMPHSCQPIRNPIGANMAFRKEVFDQVGGFRHEIGRAGTCPLGCEETELCIRTRQQRPEGRFLYQPGASVAHRVPQSRTLWRYFCSRCYAEGISKAFVSRYVGVKESLATERAYTLQTLPRGVMRGLMDVLLRRKIVGLGRAGAILAGLAITTAGYLTASAFLRAPGFKKRAFRGDALPERVPSPVAWHTGLRR